MRIKSVCRQLNKYNVSHLTTDVDRIESNTGFSVDEIYDIKTRSIPEYQIPEGYLYCREYVSVTRRYFDRVLSGKENLKQNLHLLRNKYQKVFLLTDC